MLGIEHTTFQLQNSVNDTVRCDLDLSYGPRAGPYIPGSLSYSSGEKKKTYTITLNSGL